jgi:hypothetical protein
LISDPLLIDRSQAALSGLWLISSWPTVYRARTRRNGRAGVRACVHVGGGHKNQSLRPTGHVAGGGRARPPTPQRFCRPDARVPRPLATTFPRPTTDTHATARDSATAKPQASSRDRSRRA